VRSKIASWLRRTADRIDHRREESINTHIGSWYWNRADLVEFEAMPRIETSRNEMLPTDGTFLEGDVYGIYL